MSTFYLHQVPAIVSLTNASKVVKAIQLYKVSSVYSMHPGDSIIVIARNSSELAYYFSQANEDVVISIEPVLDVSVQTASYTKVWTIEKSGSAIIEGENIVVNGTIAKATPAAVAGSGLTGKTHLVCLKLKNKNITDWSVVKHNGEALSDAEQEEGAVYCIVGANLSDSDFTLDITIQWDGSTDTVYDIDMGPDFKLG